MSPKASKTVSADFTFFRELLSFYHQNKGEIRKNYRQLTRIFLDYNDPKNRRPGQFLRLPQFEALEMYIFLKEYAKLKSVHELFKEWYAKEGIFAKRSEFLSESKQATLSLELAFPVKEYDALFKKMAKSAQQYPNYIFALTMGVGKTLLMATCIFYEFILARKFPNDPSYCHNALIFAPDKTVLQSLREIEDFDFAKVLPPEHANWVQANLRMHYLDEAGMSLSTLDNSAYNLVISNTQKIILKRKTKIMKASESLFTQSQQPKSSVYDDIADLYGHDSPEDSNELNINQRFYKLRQLPQLGIYVDEAHHAFGDGLYNNLSGVKETSLRFTINVLTKHMASNHKKMVACYNFTGTPYVKNEILPEVVYAYTLEAAINAGYLKSAKLHGYSNPRSEDFVRAVIKDFLEKYGKRRVENKLPKLAFFAPDIDDANNKLRPLVEEVLRENNIPANKILINVGDDKITKNVDLREFNNLDSDNSEKQFLILVNKGKEGWNCRSLCGVAMFRKPKSKIFILQASMRCLRSIGDKQEEGQIYLSEENIQLLNEELQQNFHLTTKDLEKKDSTNEFYSVHVIKEKKLKLTYVRKAYDCQVKELVEQVNFDSVTWDVEPYKLIHTEQKALLQKGKYRENTKSEEDITWLKKHRTWTQYTLVAEIARYINESPMKIEKLLHESDDGMDTILEHVNQYNELLYDKVIPMLFKSMYEISAYEKKIDQEVDLVKIPDSGEYRIKGDPNKTEFYNEWKNSSNPKQAQCAEKSFHLDTYCFDSKSEHDFFRGIIAKDEIQEIYFTGMLTHGQSDFLINYIDPESYIVRSYYPDFLIHTKKDEWLVVEVKAKKDMDDATVLAKKEFAQQFLSVNNIRYEMIAHDAIQSGISGILKSNLIIHSKFGANNKLF